MNSKHIATLTTIGVFIPTLYYFFFPGKIVVSSILFLYPIIILTISYVAKNKINIDIKDFIGIFILYNFFMFFRGILDAKSYQDWTTLLSSSVATFIFYPLFIFMGSKIIYAQQTIRISIFIALPLSLILLTRQLYGQLDFCHSVSYVYILILALPYLKFKQKLLIIIVSLFSLFNDLEVRANIINILMAYTIILAYTLLNKNNFIKVIKLVHIFLILMPVILFTLGVSGVFNIFKLNEYVSDISLKLKEDRNDNILVDSRTAIYRDVLQSLDTKNKIVFGLGGSGKTATSLSDKAIYEETYAEGRRGTESGMLNYIQYGGLIGATLYYIIHIFASYLAIYKAKNWFIIFLGLWISYKVGFSFIEDRIMFSIYSLYLFLSIGICFNKTFREMNNGEVTLFFRKVFNFKKYGKIKLFYLKT